MRIASPVPALALAAALALPLPLAGQTPPPETPPAETEEGLSLIQRGMGLLFRQFMDEAAPQLDLLGRDLSSAIERMAPALQDLAVLVDDIRNYAPPERLANGDIVIRRRAEAPPPPPLGEGLQRLLPEGTGPDGTRPEGRQPPLPRGLAPRNPAAPEIDI